MCEAVRAETALQQLDADIRFAEELIRTLDKTEAEIDVNQDKLESLFAICRENGA